MMGRGRRHGVPKIPEEARHERELASEFLGVYQYLVGCVLGEISLAEASCL
jgi:hypothetical protein